MGPLVLGGLLREVRVERSRWACSHTGEREYYHRLGIFCIQVVARAVPRNLHSQRALQDGKDHTQAQLGQVYTVFPPLLAVNRKLSRHCSRNPITGKACFNCLVQSSWVMFLLYEIVIPPQGTFGSALCSRLPKKRKVFLARESLRWT